MHARPRHPQRAMSTGGARRACKTHHTFARCRFPPWLVAFLLAGVPGLIPGNPRAGPQLEGAGHLFAAAMTTSTMPVSALRINGTRCLGSRAESRGGKRSALVAKKRRHLARAGRCRRLRRQQAERGHAPRLRGALILQKANSAMPGVMAGPAARLTGEAGLIAA